jgi:hypothetical protein
LGFSPRIEQSTPRDAKNRALSSRSRGQRFDGPEFPRILLLDLMNRKGILQVQPKLFRSTEIPSQTSRHLSSNSPLLPNNVIHRGSRNPQLHRQPVRGNAHGPQKLLPKNLSGMHCPTCRTFIPDTHDSFLRPRHFSTRESRNKLGSPRTINYRAEGTPAAAPRVRLCFFASVVLISVRSPSSSA